MCVLRGGGSEGGYELKRFEKMSEQDVSSQRQLKNLPLYSALLKYLETGVSINQQLLNIEETCSVSD